MKGYNTVDAVPPYFLGTFRISDLNRIVIKSYEYGCRGYDTAPSYGTEHLLGKALKLLYKTHGICREDVFIADKVDVLQMYKSNGNIEPYVAASLKKMQMEYLDLLLVHWPIEKYFYKTWESFIRLKEKGLVKAVGLCNVNSKKYKEVIEIPDLPSPSFIQNEISPLNTSVEDVDYFHQKNICVQAYSPLCQMANTIVHNEGLRLMAEKYGKTIAQIILRWHLDRGVIPVFTSSKINRLKDNMNIHNFVLASEDIELINRMNRDYKIYPESFGCPGY